MKKVTMFAIVCVLAMGLAATNALAVTLDLSSNEYLGLINNGIPASQLE